MGVVMQLAHLTVHHHPGVRIGHYKFGRYPMFVYTAETTISGVSLNYFWQTIRLTVEEFDGLLCVGLLERAR